MAWLGVQGYVDVVQDGLVSRDMLIKLAFLPAVNIELDFTLLGLLRTYLSYTSFSNFRPASILAAP